MKTARAKLCVRGALILLACAAAGGTAGCANGGTATVGYSYGAYFGDPWGYDYYYAGGPIYVGPPETRPPTGDRPGGGGPPHVSQLPSRPMPAPRPTPRAGGGRRR